MTDIAARSAARPALKSITPILRARDVAASAAFFEHQLGFAVDFRWGSPLSYAGVSRDGVCLHLNGTAGAPATGDQALIPATIEVSDLQALFDEFSTRGVAFRQPPTRQEWGGTDFLLADPDGNVLSFVSFD